MSALLATLSATAAAALFALPKAAQRLQLSRAKHPSLTGHARMARRVAGLIPHYAYSQRAFFRSDDPDETVALRRENGFARLSELYRARFARTRAETDVVRGGLSDLQFTGLYRVPFQYAGHVRAHLGAGAFAAASDGVTVTDLDGNVFYDLAGSYGVNLFGVDFYRACLEEGTAKVAALGPVLGPLHPVVTGNVARLKALSGLDEVSFHMSGTEAVMQAARLARYHTGRRRIVRFCGAYHGWWGEVQPGIGNPVPTRDTLTLADMSDRTLRVLGSRRDVACVLVNPLQAMHPNAGAPSDSALVDSARKAAFDRAAYTKWLAALRAVCTANGIVLIFDEVFLGFRLAQGGAQDYFGVRADMVTYGKTLGGGLPVGVLCGRAELMRRFRDDRPVDICFARGTFNAHPYVMGAMSAFLDRLETQEVAALYRDLDATWDARAARLNTLLAEAELPVRVSTLSTVWTVLYTRPSRYNWMLQFYLRAEGLALSWVGTGRMIFSLAYDDAAFEAVAARFVAAANAMRADGWWDGGATTDKAIRKAILREVAAIRLGKLGARLGLRAPDQV
ncbi:aminotransferase class III-fold pyridoxal phosphate-dependent enzyme [Methylobacterium sp.]|uniref:aminotransferase class III-fold pyridoxal phosphate-dependent enzyme n=1 Tax=Methylobacterium sp. TaxID=409 RepID=UPI003B009D7C